MNSSKLLIKNKQEVIDLAVQMAKNSKRGDIFGLNGTLGSGKSFFARAFINSFFDHEINVSSPTFNLLQTYESKNFTIYHYDLYRVEHISELYELGFEDALSGNVTLVEWPELAQSLLPNLIFIKIEIIDETTRRILIK